MGFWRLIKRLRGLVAPKRCRVSELGIMTKATQAPTLFALAASSQEPSVELSLSLGTGRVAGLDEVGRGPLAGPVVAAAVVLHPERFIPGLADSKKLSEKKREALFSQIQAQAWAVGVASVEADEIDSLNILQASLTAMARAFAACETVLAEEICGAVVDGNQVAPLPERVRQRTVVRGDSISPPIMAASIIAKVTRDRRMMEEARRYPAYGFEKHKGYPTAAHRAALMRFGPTPLHRRSFGPVRLALQGQPDK